jgi:hypothetical protein
MRCTSADTFNMAIRKVSSAGIVTMLVGQVAGFALPYNVLAAPNGDVFFTGYKFNVYKYSTSTGIQSISLPVDMGTNGLAYHSGNVYVAGSRLIETQYDRSSDGQVYRLLPDLTGVTKFGPPVPAGSTAAQQPQGIAFNSTGDAFVAVSTGILKGAPQGSSTPQTWSPWKSGTTPAKNGAEATQTQLSAYAVAFDAAGNMLVIDSDVRPGDAPNRCVVWLVEAATGKLRQVAGSLDGCGSSVDPNNATNTQMGRVGAVAFDPTGTSAYIADPMNQRILKVKLNCAGA